MSIESIDSNSQDLICYKRLWNTPGGWQRARHSVWFVVLLEFSTTLYAEHWILNINCLCRRAVLLNTAWLGYYNTYYRLVVQDNAVLNIDWLYRTLLFCILIGLVRSYRSGCRTVPYWILIGCEEQYWILIGCIEKKSRAVGTYHLNYISDCLLKPSWENTCSFGTFFCTYHAQYFSYFILMGPNLYHNTAFIILIFLNSPCSMCSTEAMTLTLFVIMSNNLDLWG